MIQLQTKLQSTAVAVNPKQVTHVIDSGDQGCKIVFVGGESVMVKNDYLTVVGQLVANQ
jgi:hypothetical protein